MFERQFVRFVADVNPIKKQHAKMDVEIQRRTKALYEGSGSGMGSVVRAASGVNQVRVIPPFVTALKSRFRPQGPVIPPFLTTLKSRLRPQGPTSVWG